jgi:DNA polymerase (family 10)
MRNQDIARIFYELADLLEIKGENPFKIRAYRNAARLIESMSTPLEKMIREGADISKLPGIGEKIAAKIEEIVKTGKLAKLEKTRKELPATLRTLLSIEGLGPKRVRKLYEALHITDLASLQQAALEHKIRQLPGFGPALEEKIRKGLALLKQEGVRFLYADVESIANDIKEYLHKAPDVKEVSIAGSFRRCKETVGDLDIVATSETPRKVIEHFIRYEAIAQILSAGTTRASIVLANNRLQIDLRVVHPRHYGAALLYFTGSKSHTLHLRQIAKEKGYKLNEYGLYEGNEIIRSKSEETIYKALGLSWIAPQLRENAGEFEAARKGTLPRLVTIDDIRGDLHIHTRYSDGIESIETMLRKALSLGYEYIAITDHSPSLHIAHGMDTQTLLRQLDEIDALNEKYAPFVILKGIEADILEDGSVDLDEKLLERLDIVLASVHTKFHLSSKVQTKRILRALGNPYVHALSHPTGRLIGKRPFLQVDYDAIFETCARYGKYLEINAQPLRSDLPEEYIRRAKRYDVKFLVVSDAHRAEDMDYMRYGICRAQRGWLQAEDILNTSNLETLKRYLKRD